MGASAVEWPVDVKAVLADADLGMEQQNAAVEHNTEMELVGQAARQHVVELDESVVAHEVESADAEREECQ